GVLSDRAPHLPPDGHAVAPLVARLCPEREAPLAWFAPRAVSPLRGSGGVLGRDDRGGAVSRATPPPRSRIQEPLGAARLSDRCAGRAGAGVGRRHATPGSAPGAGERSGLLRAAHGQRGVLPPRGVRRAGVRSFAARLREGALR